MSDTPDGFEQKKFQPLKRKCPPLPLDGLTKAKAALYIKKYARPKWLTKAQRSICIQKAAKSPGNWIIYPPDNGFDSSLANKVGEIVDGRTGVTWDEIDKELQQLNRKGGKLKMTAGERKYCDFLKTGNLNMNLMGVRVVSSTLQRPPSPSISIEAQEEPPRKQRPQAESTAFTPTSDPPAPQVPHSAKKTKWAPTPPPADVAQRRMITDNPILMNYLRNHPDGNYVKNPYQKVSGLHTMKKTQEVSKDRIKKVITEWLLTTAPGKRMLSNADISDQEFTIDRVISRNGHSHATNCVWNLVLMPSRTNSYFNNADSDEKAAYVGTLAWETALMANEEFRSRAELTFDFEAACSQRAKQMALQLV